MTLVQKHCSSYQDWQLNKQTHWFSAPILIVSGLIVPKMRPTNHFGNIRWLKPVKPFAYHHDYDRGEQEEAQYEESLLNPPTFFSKHTIDLTDMFLHLGKHPFVFLIKQVFYLLPVSTSDIDWDLKFGCGIFQDFVKMLFDSVNLATDVCDGKAQFPFASLILLDSRLQLKREDKSVSCLLIFCNIWDYIFEYSCGTVTCPLSCSNDTSALGQWPTLRQNPNTIFSSY